MYGVHFIHCIFVSHASLKYPAGCRLIKVTKIRENHYPSNDSEISEIVAVMASQYQPKEILHIVLLWWLAQASNGHQIQGYIANKLP